jgi:phosphoacetylglucosamine mutase
MPLDFKVVARAADQHPKPTYYQYQYGTAGFRTQYAFLSASLVAFIIERRHFCSGDRLESVVFRVAILAALRSMKHNSHAIGIMITASHNPAQVQPWLIFVAYMLIVVRTMVSSSLIPVGRC